MEDPVKRTQSTAPRDQPKMPGICVLMAMTALFLGILFGIGADYWGGWPDEPRDGQYYLQNHGRETAVSYAGWLTMYALQIGGFLGIGLMASAVFLTIIGQACQWKWVVECREYPRLTKWLLILMVGCVVSLSVLVFVLTRA